MVAGFGLGGLVYSVSVKRLIGRVGELGILLLGGALLGLAFVSVGLMPSWHWFVPTVVVLGMGYYTMHGTLQTKATELAPEARGTAVSLFAFFFFMGQATGPQLLGQRPQVTWLRRRVHRRRGRAADDRGRRANAVRQMASGRSADCRRHDIGGKGPRQGLSRTGHAGDTVYFKSNRADAPVQWQQSSAVPDPRDSGSSSGVPARRSRPSLPGVRSPRDAAGTSAAGAAVGRRRRRRRAVRRGRSRTTRRGSAGSTSRSPR